MRHRKLEQLQRAVDHALDKERERHLELLRTLKELDEAHASEYRLEARILELWAALRPFAELDTQDWPARIKLVDIYRAKDLLGIEIPAPPEPRVGLVRFER